MKKILIFLMIVLFAPILADIEVRESFIYLGDRVLDSLHIVVVDSDNDTLADSVWGGSAGNGSPTDDTLYLGAYGFDVSWDEAKNYTTYVWWRKGTATDSGWYLVQGFNEEANVSSGSGANSVTYTVIDSSGGDTALYQATVSVKTLGGIPAADDFTNSNGQVVYSLDSDSFTLLAYKPMYTFPALDTVVISGVTNDTIWGYNISIASPGSPNLCTFYGYVTDLQQGAIEGATVTATLSRNNVRDTCTGTILTKYSQSGATNSSGLFSFPLMKNKCSHIETSYNVVIKYGTVEISIPVTIPDSASYRMVW